MLPSPHFRRKSNELCHSNFPECPSSSSVRQINFLLSALPYLDAFYPSLFVRVIFYVTRYVTKEPMYGEARVLFSFVRRSAMVGSALEKSILILPSRITVKGFPRLNSAYIV